MGVVLRWVGLTLLLVVNLSVGKTYYWAPRARYLRVAQWKNDLSVPIHAAWKKLSKKSVISYYIVILIVVKTDTHLLNPFILLL